MVLIQAAAAVLLVLGSALIFRALLEIDAANHPGPTVRRLPRRLPAHESDYDLPRAA